MNAKYILSLDAGTSSSRAILFDRNGRIVAVSQREFRQIYPKPGWVEHDPLEIWETQRAVAREVLDKAEVNPSEIVSLGITNQRETTVVWNRETGRPVCNAIVWQCRRTSELCDCLKQGGLADDIRSKTGLLPDAYFSGTKLRWILENIPGARQDAADGKLLFGTIDTWLIWNLTGGKVHATDHSNASRTMLYDIGALRWDDAILNEFGIPQSMLPDVRPSSGSFGETAASVFGRAIPISGVAGDQQSALFGQRCFEAGDAKNTYGTGCFMLMNTGERRVPSANGLLTTIAWGLDGKVSYALEGSVFTAGAAIQWLRDELGLIASASDSEAMARSVPDTNGCYVVPAFTGLGAPYWDDRCRGAMFGITRGTSRADITRATLESLAYQTYDICKAMEQDSGIPIAALKVDGGASANGLLMQMQSDLSGIEVLRSANPEATAAGAAYLAGLAVDFFHGREELKNKLGAGTVYQPAIDEAARKERMQGWHRAIKACRTFSESEE